MQKIGSKFIKFGPNYLGPNCGPIHFRLKLWSENFGIIKLSWLPSLYLIIISKKLLYERININQICPDTSKQKSSQSHVYLFFLISLPHGCLATTAVASGCCYYLCWLPATNPPPPQPPATTPPNSSNIKHHLHLLVSKLKESEILTLSWCIFEFYWLIESWIMFIWTKWWPLCNFYWV